MKLTKLCTVWILLAVLGISLACSGQEADVQLLYFGFESGVNRTDAPCRIVAVVKNEGGRVDRAPALALRVSEGLTLIEEPDDLSMADYPTGQLRFYYWTVMGETAGIDYEMSLHLTSSGDLNEDGVVDEIDLAHLSGKWLIDFPAYDINVYPGDDGIIDLADFAVLKEQWQSGGESVGYTGALSENPNVSGASYVPVPEPVETAIDVCSYYYPCWYEPQRWDPLREHTPNRRPLLGYYNETNPECVDWQIKWAVENGITCFLVDWYWVLGHQTYYQWFNAYKQAQYRDYLKVAIMWANHNAPGSHTYADMVNVTNEWIDNYFNLPTYFTIDGKPAIFIWAPYRLSEDLGGAANVKAALDNSRQMARNAGYAGIHFIGLMNSGSAGMGFDGRTSYHEFANTSGNLRDYQDIVDQSPGVWEAREAATSTTLAGIAGGDYSLPNFATGPTQSFTGQGSWVTHVSWANAWVDIVGSDDERHAELSVNWYPRTAMYWWDCLSSTSSTSPWRVYADLMAEPGGNEDGQRVFALGNDHNGSYTFSLNFSAVAVNGEYPIHWTAGTQSGTYYSPTSIIDRYGRVYIHYTPETGHAYAMLDKETIFDVTISAGLTLDKVIFKNYTLDGQWDTGTLHVDNVAATGDFVFYPVADTGWHSIPETENSLIIENRTAVNFEQLLGSAKEHLKNHPKPFVIVGPMNEWGEGSYIEPCTEYGFGMYEAIRNVFSTQDAGTFPTNLIPQDVELGPYGTIYPVTHWNFNDSPQGFGAYMGVDNFRHETFTLSMLNLQGGTFSLPYFSDNTLVQSFSGQGEWQTALQNGNAVAQIVNNGPFRYGQVLVNSSSCSAISYWDSMTVSPSDALWTVSADLMAVPAGTMDAQRVFALGDNPSGNYAFSLMFDGESQGDGTYGVHWQAGSASGTTYVGASIINAWKKARFDYDPESGWAQGTLGAETIFEVVTDAGMSIDKIIFAAVTDATQLDAGGFNFDNVVAQTTEGVIRFTTTTTDSAIQVYIPHNVWLPDYSTMTITMQIVGTVPSGNAGQLFWSEDAYQWHSWVGGTGFSIPSDNKKRVYTLDVGSHPDWQGRIDRLRLDPSGYSNLDIIIYDIKLEP